VDILSYLFGSILAIKTSEVFLSIGLAILVIAVILLFYNDLFSITFNEELARTAGIKVHALNIVLILLTALTVVTSMRVVGLMLASSLLILPASTALQFQASFKRTLIIASVVAVGSVVGGLVISYFFDFAVSGTIVLLNTVLFLTVLLIKKIRSGIIDKQ
jgi:zinc transport system permease protein